MLRWLYRHRFWVEALAKLFGVFTVGFLFGLGFWFGFARHLLS